MEIAWNFELRIFGFEIIGPPNWVAQYWEWPDLWVPWYSSLSFSTTGKLCRINALCMLIPPGFDAIVFDWQAGNRKWNTNFTLLNPNRCELPGKLCHPSGFLCLWVVAKRRRWIACVALQGTCPHFFYFILSTALECFRDCFINWSCYFGPQFLTHPHAEVLEPRSVRWLGLQSWAGKTRLWIWNIVDPIVDLVAFFLVLVWKALVFGDWWSITGDWWCWWMLM